jgi:predicted PurR-regulated permease PerM
MAKQRYQPPSQGLFGMIFDSLVMLVLVFYALQAPEMISNWRHKAEAATQASAPTEAAKAAAPAVTWAQLGQNATMQAAWEKMGKDPAAAKEIIDTKFDYSIDIVKLVFVAALIAFYFYFMLTMSTKEYKQVIAEKFDP